MKTKIYTKYIATKIKYKIICVYYIIYTTYMYVYT